MEQKDYTNSIITIPNIMSASRILLIPIIILLYLKGHPNAAGIVFLVSAATDIADGIVARKFHMISNIGKMLDAIADKATQLALLALLVGKFPHLLWLLIFQLFKEAASGGTAIWAHHRTDEVVAAQWHGKLATVIMNGILVIHFLFFRILPPALSDALIILGACVLLLSLVLYLINNITKAVRGKDGRDTETGKEDA